MVTNAEDLIKRLDLFDDSEYLAELIYDMAHNEQLTIGDKYNLMESRDNILGIYKLARDMAHWIKFNKVQHNKFGVDL